MVCKFNLHIKYLLTSISHIFYQLKARNLLINFYSLNLDIFSLRYTEATIKHILYGQ